PQSFSRNSVANQRATRLVCVWNLCGPLVGQLGGVPILLSSELTTCPIFAFSLRNFIVTGLQDIDKCRQQLHDITVPLEVFEYIDQGRNPQLYTKECLERALAKNEQVKGKIDTMKPSFYRSEGRPAEMKQLGRHRCGPGIQASRFQPWGFPPRHRPLFPGRETQVPHGRHPYLQALVAWVPGAR
uniref:Mediator of RNA polymerase II transcription subunit 10 n=1 Tax=Ursus maritimus TaxID=29073 RepID=A0A452V7I8_URSMA